MSFDFSLIWNSLPLLLAGAGVTIEITAIAVGLGFIFGLITSVCRLSGVKVLQVIAVCYVNIIRGTPLLVQIFLIYFALPMVIGERINPFVAAVAACSHAAVSSSSVDCGAIWTYIFFIDSITHPFANFCGSKR